MYVRDIMTTNVVSVPSNTSVIRAKRVMEQKKLRRLPVVDKGELVGLVSVSRLEKIAPIEPVSSMWELSYSLGSLYRTPVKKIMQTNVVTATPDMTVEEALSLAQAKKVGGLVVVENGNKVVGVVTTNDFFYRIVNKVLGLGDPGSRIKITGGGEGKALEEIISVINKLSMEIITLHIVALPKATKKDLVVHVNCDDVSQLVAGLKSKGYKVDLRRR